MSAQGPYVVVAQVLRGTWFVKSNETGKAVINGCVTEDEAQGYARALNERAIRQIAKQQAKQS